MNKIRMAFTILVVLGGSLLSSCNAHDEIHQETLSPSPQAAPSSDEPLPCQGQVRYSTCYSILSEGYLLNGDYQYVVVADVTPYPRLPKTCKCDSIRYCIRYYSSIPHLPEIAVGPSEIPPEECTILDLNTSPNYNESFDPEAIPVPQFSREVCFNGTDQAVFRIPAALVDQFDLTQTIISVSGLCIIDHIPTPKVNDTTQVPCML